jgi:hypothetical protein
MKNIILLSDGTGNAASSIWRTNVWRIFESIDLTSSDQVALYDDGVGTSPFLPLALLGGAFGWGLKRNILHIYKFLCRNYQNEAKIFAFGFSRGAFTIRLLTGLVASEGLIIALMKAIYMPTPLLPIAHIEKNTSIRSMDWRISFAGCETHGSNISGESATTTATMLGALHRVVGTLGYSSSLWISGSGDDPWHKPMDLAIGICRSRTT